MSDESPRDESPAHDVPAGEGPPTEEAAAADGPPAAPPPPAAPQGGRGVFVPRWAAAVAAAVVGVLLLFGGGFAIGHVTAGEGGDHHEGRTHQEDRGAPGRGGNEGNGNNGAPRQTSGVLLGVAAQDATGGQQGAELAQVVSGSPAEAAGLQAGDVITAVDGSTVANASDLTQQVRSHQPGDQLTLTYSRGGNSTQTQVTLGSRSSSSTGRNA
jgi:membrane-associated protease RseP (regulator of RpoE activity)